ncbi:hypothetical protein [Streptomyces mirabilis]
MLRRAAVPASSEVTVEVCQGHLTLGGSVEFQGLIPVIERL